MHMCKGAAGQRNPLMTFQADRIMGMFPAVQFVYYGTVSHERCLLYHSMFFKCCQNPVDRGYSIIAAFVISLNTIVNLYGAEGLGRFLQNLIDAFFSVWSILIPWDKKYHCVHIYVLP